MKKPTVFPTGKKPSALSKLFESCIELFMSNHNLLPSERFRIWKSNRRTRTFHAGNIIDMEEIYQIVGYAGDNYLNVNPSNADKHPVITDHDLWNDGGRALSHLEAYTRNVKEKIKKYNMEAHITIDEKIQTHGLLIAETDRYYYTEYKITIRNLMINAHVSSKREMYFYPLPTSDIKSEKAGVYLVFENNCFVPSKGHQGFVHFSPKHKAYLVFKNNKFNFVTMYLDAEDSSKMELTNNIFEEGDVRITSKSDNDEWSNVVCVENNIIFSDIRSSRLGFKGENFYFRGKNTVDFLELLPRNYLHWGGYQNIDPQGKHAYTHKKMFIELMEKAVQKNDKIQESRLRRELLKCERALIQEEKTVRSLQDRFILWWSSWISDYGVSWFRPIRLLIYINALFTTIVFYSFECQSSWGLLFAEFFNPLSSLADVMNVEKTSLISSINILQKAALAIFVYEIIKIFRRFSK